MGKSDLLAEEDDGNFVLKINQDYAKKFEHRKKKEELSQLKDKYGEDNEDGSDYSDSESDEEEDDVGELVTPAVDAQIVKTIALLRTKAPDVYDPEKKFFDDEEIERAKRDWKEKQAKLKADGKPVKLKDYQRQRLLEGGDEDDDEEGEKEKKKKPLSFAEEQERAKKELKAALEAADSESDDQDNLFTVRRKTKADFEAEEEDYKSFLLENIGKGKKGGEHAIHDWTTRKRDENNEEIDENEKFLWDYILNRGWIDKDANRLPTYDELVEEEDEEAVEKAEEFEHRYNFRYEEEGGAQIVGHSRNMIDSVRRKDDKRKRERENKASRKELEKKQKEEELKRLKNLKKSEILEKLKKIQEISGSKQVPFSEVDLEGDFDPAQYDQVMSTAFNDDYYVDEDPDGKPVFEDDIDIGDIPLDIDENEEGEGMVDMMEQEAEEPVPEEPEASGEGKNKKKKKKKKKDSQPQEENFIMDADYLEQQDGAQQKQKNNGKVPKKEMNKVLDQYLEDTYQLDFEDVVGGLPTRFKYAQVKPETYGLSAVEILLADDKDLNELISLKKLAPYRAAEKQRRDAEKWKRERKKKLAEFRKRLGGELGEEGRDKWRKDEGKKKRKREEGGEQGGNKREDKKKNKKQKADNSQQGQEPSNQGEPDAFDLFAQAGKHQQAAPEENDLFNPDPSFKIKKSKVKQKEKVVVPEARLATYATGSKKQK